MLTASIRRLIMAFGLCLGMFAAGAAGLLAARAQTSDGNGVYHLSRAQKAYESGDLGAASAALDEAFQSGLSKDLSARAILLRAQISERNGSLAHALQDYSAALWMDMLPPGERKKASDGKQRVIAAMGLNSPSPGPSPPGGDGRQAAAAGGGAAPPPPRDATAASSGVLGVFDGLFGSSRASAPEAASAPRTGWQTETAAAAVSAQAPAAAPVTHRKNAETSPPKTAAAPKAARAEKVSQPAQSPVKMASMQPVSVSPAPSANGFSIVFGSAASEAAGRTKAHQIKAAVADILVSRELDVEASPEGGFRIVAGPYKAKSAALALCSAMKQRGVNCLVAP